MSRPYFAYGSNLDAEQMAERCPGCQPEGRARLADYRLDFTWYSTRWEGGAADIVSEPGAEVWGVVYRMEDEHWRKLDPFESGYDRIDVQVEDPAGRIIAATSYTVRQKGAAPPADVYLDKMVRWSTHWSLPSEYVEALKRWRGASGPEG